MNISKDDLWRCFDRERRKAWESGKDIEVGSHEWVVAAAKIDVINNLCAAANRLPAAPRSDKDDAVEPVFKMEESVVHSLMADGSGGFEKNKWADWTCPVCGWFVGEQYVTRRHNQQKSNFCSRCGQRIDWSKVENEL